MIERLIESQRKYFGSGFTLDVKTRLGYLKKLKNAIKQRESKLCECLYYDLGKTASEAYMTEIGCGVQQGGHQEEGPPASGRRRQGDPAPQ